MTALSWAWARVDDSGPGAAGRRAMAAALVRLGPDLRVEYAGSRPVVHGDPGISVSVSHTRRTAVAVAGPVAGLGVDLCELDQGARIRGLAARYFTEAEQALAADDRAAAMVWAAKEAGLKALGHGLLSGGIFDGRCAVEVGSLRPPAFHAPADLGLSICEVDGCALAVAYTAPSTTTVAPFM